MASRRTPVSKPEPLVLTVEQKRRRIEQLRDCIRRLEAFDPHTVQKRTGQPEVIALQASITQALDAAFGHGTPAYSRYSAAAMLDNGPWVMHTEWGRPSFGSWEAQEAHDARQYFAEGKQRSIALLQQAISTLEYEIADQDQLAPLPLKHQTSNTEPQKIFVVHGHDEAARETVARFLEGLNLEAIILKEQPNQGLTIIEKFEKHAAEVGFAVVILTPDDVAEDSMRARQNVIFELGFFVGRLGRGRASLLRKGAVEMPSDLYGVIYTDLDVAEGWKLKLVKELKAAELDFDANLMW
jgi:predicted nucleotide-binding protein